MSDRPRQTVCMMIIVISILLCVLPSLLFSNDNAVRYRIGHIREWMPERIKTEHNGPVKVNIANRDELTSLYGIGKKLAGMIIEERTDNGPYYYPEDLMAVKGIGPDTLKRFRSMIDLSQDERGE